MDKDYGFMGLYYKMYGFYTFMIIMYHILYIVICVLCPIVRSPLSNTAKRVVC